MGAWIMIGLLAADIILQLSGLGGNVQWDWHEMGKRISYRMFQTAVDQANPAAAYHMRRTHKLIRSEYVPSPEDLEAVAEENSAALLEDMPFETKTALIDRLDYYIKLNDYVTIYFYKNEDGSLCDNFGLSYFEGDRVRSMKSLDDKFLNFVRELVNYGKVPSDSGASEKQRLKFFDLAREYRFDYIPVFTEDDGLEINDIKWHIYSYLGFPEELRGRQFNDAAYKLYGKRFEIGDDDIVMLEMGSYNKNGYMKLEEYNCVQDIDGNETVTAVLELYDYEKGYDSMPLLSQVLETVSVDDDDFIRSAVGDKSIERYGEPVRRYIISYTSSDGYTPQRLISCIKYYNNGGEWIEVN